MTEFITKTFDWKAASQRISDELIDGNKEIQTRVEKHIGMLVFRQHQYGKVYDGPNALATTFFDMDGITFSRFSKSDSLYVGFGESISQEEYMLRLMELKYAMKVVYSDATAQEAFECYSVGDHDT